MKITYTVTRVVRSPQMLKNFVTELYCFVIIRITFLHNEKYCWVKFNWVFLLESKIVVGMICSFGHRVTLQRC